MFLTVKQAIPRPGEDAGAIAHLRSPRASYANGHTYVIDGGGTAGYFDS